MTVEQAEGSRRVCLLLPGQDLCLHKLLQFSGSGSKVGTRKFLSLSRDAGSGRAVKMLRRPLHLLCLLLVLLPSLSPPLPFLLFLIVLPLLVFIFPVFLCLFSTPGWATVTM